MRARLAVVAGLAAAVAVRAAWWEPRHAQLRECELVLPQWPAALDGLRVALVADLHAGGPHVDEDRIDRLVDALQDAAPDVVALLGDFADEVDATAVAQRLRRLRAPVGVAAVLGNHDDAATALALREAGITVLDNGAVRLDARGTPLWLAGIADLTTGEPRLHEALEAIPPDEPVIVLSHDPDAFARVPERIALTVSGHTHGGQVDLPGVRERVVSSRYKDGHVVEGERHLFVSRGIGTSRLPVRLLARPEIPVLRLASPRCR